MTSAVGRFFAEAGHQFRRHPRRAAGAAGIQAMPYGPWIPVSRKARAQNDGAVEDSVKAALSARPLRAKNGLDLAVSE